MELCHLLVTCDVVYVIVSINKHNLKQKSNIINAV